VPRIFLPVTAAFVGVVAAGATPGLAAGEAVAPASPAGVTVRTAAPEPAPPELLGPALLGRTPNDTAAVDKAEPWEIRRRVVTVNRSVLTPLCDRTRERVGGQIKLTLFPDAVVVAEPDSTGTTFRRDSVRWAGEAVGIPDSSVTLTAIGLCDTSPALFALSGSVKVNGEEFTIEPRSGGRVAITEINSTVAGLAQKPDFKRQPAQRHAPRVGRPAPQAGPAVIDALVLYTPGAVKQAGGADQIQSWIEDAAARANHSLTKSDVNASFRIVHMEKAAGYRGGETVQPAFDHLTDLRDGVLDQAVGLRDKYRADIVTTVVEGYAPDNPVAGLSSYPENPTNPATSDQIWSVVAANQLWAYVLAHEWGHLLGQDHDWQTSPEKNPYYPDNHGFVAPDSSFVTIMGYPTACRTPCPYAGYYSNPKLSYDGQRLGVPLGAARSADNTRVMNLTAPEVAAYRSPRKPRPGNTLAITSDPPKGGTATPKVEGPYKPGDMVAVTAAASPGFHFTGYSLDGEAPTTKQGDTLHVRMNGDRRLVAHFAKGDTPVNGVLAAATPGQGGRVTLSQAGPDTDPVPQVLATATPYAGFTFTGWLLDGRSAGDDPQLTVEADHRYRLTARFAPRKNRRIKITVVPGNGGRVSISGTAPSATGSDIVVQARPARGFTFARWRLNDRPRGDDPVAALTVKGGERLTAVFAAVRES
jgi:hypothetical protein